ncbi:MAG: Bacterial extracellular solute-binding protein family 3 [Actinomycetota bacterium]|jgi:ABC-type amino acid transport substrate-binding protein|nr:Bacterial extracellular solute-binding protein family 3 [Actinomycetota bacterium]
MLKRVLLLVCALALLTSCVPPEESNDKVKRYDPEENVMGQIQERGVLRIAVPSDHPPFAIVENGQVHGGFLVEIGTLAAESLGVEPEFSAYPSDQLLGLIEDNPKKCTRETEVDLVFPMVPITEELLGGFTLTDPYWVGHTRELTEPPRRAGGISLPSPDVELLKIAYENPGVKITGEEQSTEGYGAASRCGTTTFGTLISQVFNEADAEGDWSRFYEEWLAEYFAEPEPDNVPIMSVEDAAALHPEGI